MTIHTDAGELLIKRIGAMRLNSNWLVGYIAGHSPELMDEILTELEASELSELADGLLMEGSMLWNASREIQRLASENANLKGQLDGHRRAAMIRSVAHDPIEGPCREDHMGDPHDWAEDEYGIDVCTRCGAECSQ